MKIAMVSPRFPPQTGGVEHVAFELARRLWLSGDDVTVFAYRPPRLPRATCDYGFSVKRYHSLGGKYEFSPLLPLALRRASFDVCHVHNIHSTAPAAVWLSRRRPYVVTTHYHGGGHSALARLLHKPYRPMSQAILKGAAAITAVSQHEAALVRGQFGLEPLVIPNGVDLRAIRSIRRARTGDGEVRIIIVSRLDAYKRVDLAIEALAHLPSDHRLTVIGVGPERMRLLALVRELGLDHRVSFQMRLSQHELWELMRDADVCLNLSEREAFSLVVLESLAAGTPVVVSASSALTEWSSRFPTAVTSVEDLSAQRIAQAIRETASRRVAPNLEDYDWESTVSRLRGIYRQVAS